MFPEDDFEELPDGNLPEGFSEEKMVDLVERTTQALDRVGLHLAGFPRLEGTDDGRTWLVVNCEIGNLAFSKRVQDREQAEFDKQFSKFEVDATQDRIEDIKKRFMRGNSSGSETPPDS